MRCPVCESENLVMSERQGIEIDYCPKCRGVWLDRGELDKIIERAAPQVEQSPPAQAAPPPYQQPRYQQPHDQKPHYHKKRKSWLHELFD